MLHRTPASETLSIPFTEGDTLRSLRTKGRIPDHTDNEARDPGNAPRTTHNLLRGCLLLSWWKRARPMGRTRVCFRKPPSSGRTTVPHAEPSGAVRRLGKEHSAVPGDERSGTGRCRPEEAGTREKHTLCKLRGPRNRDRSGRARCDGRWPRLYTWVSRMTAFGMSADKGTEE